uniref:SKA complex subunit 1 n=1 Tax=Heterorhabditis bacteriophora TaxID=37862 RepID=A0A1I7XKU0_HETBA
MGSQLDLPLDNAFLDPIMNRRNEIVENIETILPPTKVQQVQTTTTVDDKSLASTKVKGSNNTEAIKVQHIVQPLTVEEFESIPKYMRGRMTESELNDIIARFDEFLLEKRRLLRVPFNKLSVKDKDQICKWKEQVSTTGLNGPKMGNKKDSDKSPSWVGEKEINPDLITDTKYTISVLGPEKCKSNDDCNGDITKMDIVVQKIPRPEYPDLETVLVLMPYEVVREQYTAQLFRYYEQITFLPSEEEH